MQYLLLYNDALVMTDDFSINVLKICDGLTPAENQKAMSQNPLFLGIDNLEERVERTLTDAGKYGIINWIPFSQPHIDRM